ncbi:hypothetical protein ABPG74_012075 [Tetrahymena malaccensis]
MNKNMAIKYDQVKKNTLEKCKQKLYLINAEDIQILSVQQSQYFSDKEGFYIGKKQQYHVSRLGIIQEVITISSHFNYELKQQQIYQDTYYFLQRKDQAIKIKQIKQQIPQPILQKRQSKN